MLSAINIILLLLCGVTFLGGYYLSKSWKRINVINNDDFSEIETYGKSLYIIATVLLIAFAGYHISVWLHWETHVLEWLTLLIRWAHVVLGIAWIGASFYFIFLENSLNRTENLRDELAGNLWAIHGGGFYYLEKFKVAPKELPKTLHWFKYEAYFTWLTGFILLLLVYYINAKAYLVDPAVKDISPDTAIYIGLGSMISGWLIYDFLCRTSLIHKKTMFAVTGFLILTAISFLLSQYLSGRAAFMHVGALLGTIMAGNVFFVIIPAQKAMVAAAKKGIPVNPELGKFAGLRSLHNNYITLPVIFVMISNHFPVTYSGSSNWIILGLLTLGSVAVRHYINLHEKGIYAKWMLPFAVISVFALVIITAPDKGKKYDRVVTDAEVRTIINARCITCHSSHPTDSTQLISPNGVMFDTQEQLKQHADRIYVRAVQTKTMPQGNKTGITEEERTILGAWIEQNKN